MSCVVVAAYACRGAARKAVYRTHAIAINPTTSKGMFGRLFTSLCIRPIDCTRILTPNASFVHLWTSASTFPYLDNTAPDTTVCTDREVVRRNLRRTTIYLRKQCVLGQSENDRREVKVTPAQPADTSESISRAWANAAEPAFPDSMRAISATRSSPSMGAITV